MMPRAAVAALAFAAALVPAAAHAACAPTPASPTVEIETGASSSAVSNDRGAWNGRFVTASVRGTDGNGMYARAERDERFGAADDSYEAGIYARIAPRAIASFIAASSPQHNFLPQTVLGGSLDLREGSGYGLQAGYASRTYSTQRASLVSAGADRYAGASRVAFTVTFAQLSGVPGIAMTETLQASRYLSCDTLSAAVSVGRDVENVTAGGPVAVFPTFSLDVNDLHWLSTHTALNAGVGWNVLGRAYSRLEVRVALRQRF